MEQTQSIHAVPTYSMLAIFSLVFGVLAWTLLPIMGMATIKLSIFNIILMPLMGSVVASVCGQLAQRQIRHSDGALRGEGLAKAARIMAYTQYVLVGLMMVAALLQPLLRSASVIQLH